MANNAFVVGGNNNRWNFSDPSKEGFSNQIQGPVIKLVRRQGIDFNTKQPATWPDGNPRLVYVLTIQDQNSGENRDWVVDAKKSGVGIRAIGAALGVNEGDPVDISRLYGMVINVATPGLQSMKINGRSCTARVWQVQVLGQAPVGTNLLGIEDQVNATSAQQRSMQQQPIQQQPIQQQPIQQQPMQQQQPVQQISYQQMQQVVQNNQQGSVFAQAPQTSIYDEDIPF